jgi:primosomal protein N''
VNLGSIKHKELERANRLALAYERLRDDIAEYVRRKMQTGPGYTLADLEERLAKCLADIDRIEKEN